MLAARYLPRFQQAYRALEEFAARETWSRQQVESYQLARINDLWAQSIRHVPHYHELAKQSPRLRTEFASLQEFQSAVPILEKRAVNQSTSDFLSSRAEPGKWRQTSGSTGDPTRLYSSHRAHREMLRAQYRMQQMWGVDIFAKSAYVWGRSSLFIPGWKGTLADWSQKVEDRLRNRLRLSAYRLEPDVLNQYVQALVRFQPERVYGYSAALYLLAGQFEQAGATCESLKLITMTSEPAFPRMVRAMERVFCVPAVVEYGATECGVIASEWPDRTLRVREDLVFVETVPQSDGRFRLLITVLNNPSFPLIRYAIGDLTDAPIQSPDQGFSILQAISGRDNELLIGRSGRRLHPTFAEGIFEYEYFDQIRRFFIHQKSDGALDVSIELKRESDQVDRVRLRNQLRALVEGYPVQLQVVDRIQPLRNGKNQWVTSDLARSLSGDR